MIRTDLTLSLSLPTHNRRVEYIHLEAKQCLGFMKQRSDDGDLTKTFAIDRSISSPGLGLGLRPGFPLILGVLSSGFVPDSLPSLLHLRTLLLEQLATSSAGDGSAPGQKHRGI